MNQGQFPPNHGSPHSSGQYSRGGVNRNGPPPPRTTQSMPAYNPGQNPQMPRPNASGTFANPARTQQFQEVQPAHPSSRYSQRPVTPPPIRKTGRFQAPNAPQQSGQFRRRQSGSVRPTSIPRQASPGASGIYRPPPQGNPQASGTYRMNPNGPQGSGTHRAPPQAGPNRLAHQSGIYRNPQATQPGRPPQTGPAPRHPNQSHPNQSYPNQSGVMRAPNQAAPRNMPQNAGQRPTNRNAPPPSTGRFQRPQTAQFQRPPQAGQNRPPQTGRFQRTNLTGSSRRGTARFQNPNAPHQSGTTRVPPMPPSPTGARPALHNPQQVHAPQNPHLPSNQTRKTNAYQPPAQQGWQPGNEPAISVPPKNADLGSKTRIVSRSEFDAHNNGAPRNATPPPPIYKAPTNAELAVPTAQQLADAQKQEQLQSASPDNPMVLPVTEPVSAQAATIIQDIDTANMGHIGIQEEEDLLADEATDDQSGTSQIIKPVVDQTAVTMIDEAEQQSARLAEMSAAATIIEEASTAATIAVGDTLVSSMEKTIAVDSMTGASLSAGAKSLSMEGSLRRYADGVLRSIDGSQVDSEEDSSDVAPKLPYNSFDVQLRIGSYDVLEQLGAGAMGVVYKGYSVKLCREVAIKVIAPDSQASPTAIRRFHNEAILAARLKHPNIVPIYDSGTDGDLHYFVMAFIPGRSLGDVLKAMNEDREDYDMKKLTTLIIKCARALDYAHEQGIYHRDIKPDNIMIDEKGEPHIADFGLATEKPDNPNPNATGAIMGTPQYMPPEQANGELHNLGPASDVYSLGATMYSCLAGRAPFVARNVIAVIRKVLHEEASAPSTHELGKARHVPLDLDTIVLKSLEKQVSQRYPSAGAFADDLQCWLDAKPISARPISAAERFQKFLRRNKPALVGTFVLVSVILTVIGAFASVSITNARRGSETLKDNEIKAAVKQAETLATAIRTNMLQGRADQARELVSALSKADDQTTETSTDSVTVARPADRTIAYFDQSTRKFVQNRLAEKSVLAWIAKKYPDFMVKVNALKDVALPSIKSSKRLKDGEEANKVQVDLDSWAAAIKTNSSVTYYEKTDAGHRNLVVLYPIQNDKKCQICHGTEGSSEEPGRKKMAYFGSAPVRPELLEKVRAMLVVRRSQKELDSIIKENNRTIVLVGFGTVAIFGLLIMIIVQFMGVNFMRRTYS